MALRAFLDFPEGRKLHSVSKDPILAKRRRGRETSI